MTQRKTKASLPVTTQAPAITSQDRENQLIAAAIDLAEQQIRGGTASAQVITHYLKLGSSRERLEQTKIGLEGDLLVTKKEMLESEKRVEDLYKEALTKMSAYQGNLDDVDGSDEDDDEVF